MDPIKNTGAVDYAMTVPQNQAQDYGNYDDYSTMPMVYDPEIEDKKNASSNMLGMTALGILGVAGLAYGAVKHKKVGDLNKQITELTTKNETALKELDTVRNELAALKEAKTESKNPFKRAIAWVKNKFKPAKKAEVKAEGEAPKVETPKPEGTKGETPKADEKAS